MTNPLLTNPGRLLIADDEPLFLRATADILREEGYPCETVTDAEGAIVELERGSYSLLIADINMPGNSQLELVRRVREIHPLLPIILITGFPDLDTAIEGIELQIDSYLLKPIEAQALLNKVEKTLSSSVLQNQKTKIERKLGEVGHDLTNMLNVIGGYLTLSQEALEPDHHAQVYYKETRLALQKATELTQGLIEVSKPEGTADSCPIDFPTLFGELRSLARTRIRENAELVFSLPDSFSKVLGKRNLLLDALFNLVSNASDALPEEGGEIRIVASHTFLNEKDCQAIPGVLFPGRFLVLEVIDNGCGIPSDIVHRVQEPFFTTKPEGEGTGLGLAVVSRTVQSMGGEIEIQSSPRRGTTVRLYLPCYS